MSRPKQAPLVLTARGEAVFGALAFITAVVVCPACLWAIGKMWGM